MTLINGFKQLGFLDIGIIVMNKSNLVGGYAQHQQGIADIAVAIPLVFLGCIAIAEDGLGAFADRGDCPDLPDIPRTG